MVPFAGNESRSLRSRRLKPNDRGRLAFTVVDGQIDVPVRSLANIPNSADVLRKCLFDYDLLAVHREARKLLT